MKRFLALWLLTCGLALGANAPAPVLADPTTGAIFRPTSGLSGNLTVPSGKTATFNGTLTGTPTGGTLDLSSVTFSMPDVVSGGATIGRTQLGPREVTSDGNYNAFPGIAKTSGTLLIVYRKAETHASDIGTIVSRTSTDLGLSWGEETTLLSDDTYDLRDPSLARLADGSLIISFFKYSVGGTALNAFTSRSTDNGVTWSTPVNVGGYTTWGACSSPVVQLASGDLLLATYGVDGVSGAASTATKVSKSTDGGASWSTLATIAGENYDETNLVVLPGGNIVALIRNENTNYAAVATSTDNGATWSAVSDKFACTSAPRVIRLSDARLLVAYRSNTAPFVGQLAMRSSDDDGATWGAEIAQLSSSRATTEYAAFTSISTGLTAMAYAAEASSSDSAIYFRYVADYSAGTVSPAVNAEGLVARDGGVFVDGGNVSISPSAGASKYVVLNGDGTLTGSLVLQAGGGSALYGGALNLFSAGHATKPGWVTIGLGSSASGRKFTVNTQGLAGGSDIFTVGSDGAVSAASLSLTTALAANAGGTGFANYTLGDMLYASGASALSKLAGNTSTTPRVLMQTGTGSASSAPAWTTLTQSHVSGLTASSTPTFAGVTLTNATAPAVTLSPDTVNAYILYGSGNTGTGRLSIQAGGGSTAFGGTLSLFPSGHATRAGYVTVGFPAGGKFTVNTQGFGDGTDVMTVDRSGNIATSGSLSTGAPSGSTAGSWKLGSANTVSPTSPNRTIAIDIGGTVYYLAAKTTND